MWGTKVGARAALLLALGGMLLSCGADNLSSSATTSAATSTTTSTSTTTTTAAPTTTTTTAPAALPVEGECQVDYSAPVAAQLATTCAPSCTSILTIMDLGTNPGLSDLLAYETGYLRITDTAGQDPEPGVPLAIEDSVIELLGIYGDRSDPNVVLYSASETRWGPTGRPAASATVIYDAYWSEEGQINIPVDPTTREVQHPLRERAQFLDTAAGCTPNPHHE